MQLPVIATAVEGVPELIHHNETGILIPPKEVKAISNGIIKMLENPIMGKKMSKRGKFIVLKNFSAKKMVKEIDDLYQKCIIKSELTNYAQET
jgi:glycosyltransferase involved in cell wall biosynthesis